MARIELRVIICGTPAGTLVQDEVGRMSFHYDEGYAGAPLSLSMPTSNRSYGQRTVRPYLFGLLPDNDMQRAAIGLEHDVRPNNPVALLDAIGLDCPGGVQFCRPEDEAKVLAREGSYRPLDDHEIAARLRAIRTDRSVSWVGERESWSLGGNQGKFALAWHDGAWCSCSGSSPTTHIFKNGVAGFMLQALNEYVCMRLARYCDIEVANVEYRFFEDEPALVVERYDRAVDDGGALCRLHQEDLCQALSVMPFQKYTSDGGPATADVLRLLGSTDHDGYNLFAFTQMLFFNYLIGAPDAHAKNYSLLLGAGGNAVLARMYDVASGLAYDGLRRKGRLAMAIGGENRFGRVSRRAVERYEQTGDFEAHGLRKDTPLAVMSDLAQSITEYLPLVFDEIEQAEIPGAAELREHMESCVIDNCATTLRML